MTLAERVADVLSGVGLLLVFVIALFDLSYQRIQSALEGRAPGADRPVERRRYRVELREVLIRRAAPPTVVSGVVAYALAPLVQDVIASTELELWDFDELLTIFVLLYLLIVGFAVWSLVLLIRVAAKLRRARAET